MRKHRLTFALALGLGLTGLPSAVVAADQTSNQAERSRQEADKSRDRSGNIAKDGTAEVGESGRQGSSESQAGRQGSSQTQTGRQGSNETQSGRQGSNDSEAARRASDESKQFFGDQDPGNDFSRTERVREIQSTLREDGYYDGEIDGIPGPQTAEAIRKFQTEEDLTATGRMDKKTSNRLDKSTKKHRKSTDQYSRAGQATKDAMDKTGSAAKRGAEATGQGVRAGAQAVGSGAGAAVEHGSRGAAKAGEQTASAARSTGSAVADFFGDDDPGDNGQRADRVRKVQEKLKSEGHYDANVDGEAGPETAEALREYQRANDLDVTGRLDSETVAKMDIKK